MGCGSVMPVVGTRLESRSSPPTRLIWLFCLAHLMSIFGGNRGQEEFSEGRIFALNPEPLSWEVAREACGKLNGTLARLFSLSTLPDLYLTPNWTLWLGARVTQEGAWLWEDGAGLSYANWEEPDRKPAPGECATVSTAFPLPWRPAPCSRPLPSLCMISAGSCRFERQNNASILAHNDARRNDVDDQGCEALCLNATAFLCRSYEYNYKWGKLCQLSASNRWMLPNRFVSIDPEWTYFHRTCNTGMTYAEALLWLNPPVSSEVVTPSSTLAVPSSTPCPILTTMSVQVLETTVIQTLTSVSVTTTTVTTTATTTMMMTVTPSPSPSPTPTPGRTVMCREVRVPEPGVTPIPEEVRELQELNSVIKQKAKANAKTSKSDPRRSATYVGTIFVGILMSLLGGLIVIDLVSLPQRFREMRSTVSEGGGGKAKGGRKYQLRRIGQHRRTPEKSKCPSSRSRLAEMGLENSGRESFTGELGEEEMRDVRIHRITFNSCDSQDPYDDVGTSARNGGRNRFQDEANGRDPDEAFLDARIVENGVPSHLNIDARSSVEANDPQPEDSLRAVLDNGDISVTFTTARERWKRLAGAVNGGPRADSRAEDRGSPLSDRDTNYYFYTGQVGTRELRRVNADSGDLERRDPALPSIYDHTDSNGHLHSTFL